MLAKRNQPENRTFMSFHENFSDISLQILISDYLTLIARHTTSDFFRNIIRNISRYCYYIFSELFQQNRCLSIVTIETIIVTKYFSILGFVSSLWNIELCSYHENRRTNECLKNSVLKVSNLGEITRRIP